MGRPKLTNTKDTFLHIRLNKNERQNVEDVCLQNNLSMVKLIRICMINRCMPLLLIVFTSRKKWELMCWSMENMKEMIW